MTSLSKLAEVPNLKSPQETTKLYCKKKVDVFGNKYTASLHQLLYSLEASFLQMLLQVTCWKAHISLFIQSYLIILDEVHTSKYLYQCNKNILHCRHVHAYTFLCSHLDGMKRHLGTGRFCKGCCSTS